MHLNYITAKLCLKCQVTLLLNVADCIPKTQTQNSGLEAAQTQVSVCQNDQVSSKPRFQSPQGQIQEFR